MLQRFLDRLEDLVKQHYGDSVNVGESLWWEINDEYAFIRLHVPADDVAQVLKSPITENSTFA